MKSLFYLLFLVSSFAVSQTTVTGTIVDPNGNSYANGTASAYSVAASGQPMLSTSPVSTNASGLFTLSLNSGTYVFTICAPPVKLGPTANPTPTQICFSSSPIAISGGSQDISATLNSLAPLLGPTLTSVPGGVASGSQLVSRGLSLSPVYQTKPAIDVRDTAGIDCTGSSDSSSALNTVFSNLRGGKVIIPAGCNIRVDSQAQILNQTNFILEGQSAVPNQTVAAPSIFGCNGSAGAVLYINRSSVGQIKNLAVYAKGNACSSNFTQSVRVDNTGSSGFTTTNMLFDGMAVGTSEGGGAITNYVGFNFTGTPNMEQMRVLHSDIECQFSSNSYGIWYNGANADDGEVSANGISSCFQAIRVDQGNPRISNNLLGNNGGYTHFGNNNLGAAIHINSCSSGPMIVIGNEQSSGGPFINSDQVSNQGCGRLSLIANEMGADDLQNGAFVVEVGDVGGFTYMEGNDIGTLHNPNVTGVGSNSQGTSGPLGQLIALNNTSDAGLGFSTQKWQAGQLIIPGTTSTGTVPTLASSMDHQLYQAQQGTPIGGTGRSASYSFTSGAGDSFVLANVPQNGGGSASLVLSHPSSSVSPTFALDGPIGGIVNVSSLNSPGALYQVVATGGNGSTTWAYAVVGTTANGACHTAASPSTQITNGVATLSGSTFNSVQWFPDPGIVYYNVYRTTAGGTPNTTGLIGRAYVTQMGNTLGNGDRVTFSDTGLAGDSSIAPATNTCIGAVQAGTLNVTGVSTLGSGSTKFIQTNTASNSDLAGELSFSAATTSNSYSFTGTYTSHPECTITPQFSPGASHVIWISTLSTSTLQLSSDTAQTGAVSYICISRN